MLQRMMLFSFTPPWTPFLGRRLRGVLGCSADVWVGLCLRRAFGIAIVMPGAGREELEGGLSVVSFDLGSMDIQGSREGFDNRVRS